MILKILSLMIAYAAYEDAKAHREWERKQGV